MNYPGGRSLHIPSNSESSVLRDLVNVDYGRIFPYEFPSGKPQHSAEPTRRVVSDPVAHNANNEATSTASQMIFNSKPSVLDNYHSPEPIVYRQVGDLVSSPGMVDVLSLDAKTKLGIDRFFDVQRDRRNTLLPTKPDDPVVIFKEIKLYPITQLSIREQQSVLESCQLVLNAQLHSVHHR